MKLKDMREQLTTLIEGMAEKARSDAKRGEVDLSDILGVTVDDNELKLLDEEEVRSAVEGINTLTRTKAGARRLVAALTVAIKHASKLV